MFSGINWPSSLQAIASVVGSSSVSLKQFTIDCNEKYKRKTSSHSDTSATEDDITQNVAIEVRNVLLVSFAASDKHISNV